MSHLLSTIMSHRLPAGLEARLWSGFGSLLALAAFGLVLPHRLVLPQSALAGLEPFLTGSERLVALLSLLLFCYLSWQMVWRRGVATREVSSMARQGSRRLPTAIAALLLTTFSAGSIDLVAQALGALAYGAYDYGGLSRAVTSLARGEGVLESAWYPAANGSLFYLGHHFSPVLLLYLPFTFLSDSPLLYGVLLQLTLALGLWGWFLLLRYLFRQRRELVERGGDWPALVLWLLFLLQPLLQRQALSDHYELFVVAASALLFASLFVLASPTFSSPASLTVSRRGLEWLAFVGGVLLWLSIKEDSPLMLGLFSLLLLSGESFDSAGRDGRKRLRIAGGVMLFLSVVWFVLVTRVVMPGWSGEGESRFLAYWGHWGGSPLEIALSMILDPIALFASLNEKRDLLWPTLLTLALLPLWRWRLAILVLVPLYLFHSSAEQPFFSALAAYYGYTLIPFLWLGTLLALWRLRSSALVLMLLALVSMLLFWQLGRDREWPWRAMLDTTAADRVHELLAAVAPDSTLCSRSHIVPIVPSSIAMLPIAWRVDEAAPPPMALPWRGGEALAASTLWLRGCDYLLIDDPATLPLQRESGVRLDQIRLFAEQEAELIERSGPFRLYRLERR